MSLSDLLFPNTTGMTFTDNSCTTQTTDSSGYVIPCYICKEKCQFSYADVTFKSTCRGETGAIHYNEITVQNSLNQSPLKFNEDYYSITSITLLVPSLGKYESADCELVIKSSSTYGNLNIFIPVTSGSNGILNNITSISDNDGNAQSYDEYFKLSDYIPQMPYIFYNTTTANYIVFPVSPLTISTSLKNLIVSTKPIVSQYYKGTLYYNPKGPGDTPDSNQIYINCSPTDHSDEATTVPKDSTNIKPYLPPTSVLDKKWLFYIIIPVVIIIVCYITIRIILYAFTPFTPKETKALTN
jgi:hypothetical protein